MNKIIEIILTVVGVLIDGKQVAYALNQPNDE